MIRIINEDGYQTLKAIYKAYQTYKANHPKVTKQKLDKKATAPKEQHYEFKPFTRSDWNDYPGAQKFSDGSEPLIYKSDHVTIVFSGDPAGAWVAMEYTNGNKNYVCERTFNKRNHAASMVNAIAGEINRNPDLSPDEFIDVVDSFGFELI